MLHFLIHCCCHFHFPFHVQSSSFRNPRNGTLLETKKQKRNGKIHRSTAIGIKVKMVAFIIHAARRGHRNYVAKNIRNKQEKNTKNARHIHLDNTLSLRKYAHETIFLFHFFGVFHGKKKSNNKKTNFVSLSRIFFLFLLLLFE